MSIQEALVKAGVVYQQRLISNGRPQVIVVYSRHPEKQLLLRPEWQTIQAKKAGR